MLACHRDLGSATDNGTMAGDIPWHDQLTRGMQSYCVDKMTALIVITFSKFSNQSAIYLWNILHLQGTCKQNIYLLYSEVMAAIGANITLLTIDASYTDRQRTHS